MRKEVKIGLTGIASLILLFVGINYLKGINLFKPESYYIVKFRDINGLTVSSPVFANGFKIGIVRDLELDPKQPEYVAVGIKVDDNIRIPRNSHAELVSEMLGTVKMNMILDHSSGNYCQPGDTIPGISNNGIMGVAQNDILPKIQQMVPKIDSVITALNKILNDPQIAQTLNHTERLTASLERTGRALEVMMRNDMPAIARNMHTVSENLVVVSGNLRNIDFASTAARVDSTIENVRLLTQKLNRKDNSLGLLLNDTGLYNNLNTTLDDASSLLRDLKNNPKRYVHFSVFGRKN